MENERATLEPAPFGSLLRRYRLAAGLSQEALAERARVSAQGIGALERGDRRTPQRETLALLADALALTTEQRRSLEAAAAVRAPVPRPGRGRVTEGPWPTAPPAGLPLSLTSFVGRTSELAQIVALLGEQRLVTLTGPGGIGKSRMALEVGAAFAEAAGVEARLIEFAPLADGSRVVGAIAAALGLQEVANHPLIDTLLAHLQREQMLLLLDNCEHVIEQAATIAERLLRGCAGVRVLATSREPLHASGEHVYRLLRIAAQDAIALFADRAHAADYGFALTAENQPLVARICERLDGIPLALEIAAARTSTLDVVAIAERLDRRLLALRGSLRTAAPRQQTMRGAIDWSYELLAVPQRRAFERLSVFAGGCTLESAAEVCGAEVGDAFDALASLVEKSLVIADDGGETTRYRMLEPFREYAREKLVERAELDAIQLRHAHAYLALALRLLHISKESADRDWTAAARVELDNWRVALDWALLRRHDVEVGQQMATALRNVWFRYSVPEGVRWLRAALEACDANTPAAIVAELENVYARFCYETGDLATAVAAASRAAEKYRALGDPAGIAAAQREAGQALMMLSRPDEAEPLLREALDFARAHQSRSITAYLLQTLAWLWGGRDTFDRAREACSEALAIYEALDQSNNVVSAMLQQAEIEYWAGDGEAALRLGLRALEIARADDGSANLQAWGKANVAAYLIAGDRFDDARSYAQAALESAGREHLARQETWAIQHLAAVGALRPHALERRSEELSRAARLIGFVEARYATVDTSRTETAELERVKAALHEALPADRVATLLGEGATMAPEAAVAEAQSI